MLDQVKTEEHGEPAGGRIAELDGIRGMAILLVILYHYVAVSVPANAGAGWQFLRQLFSNGWSGVDLFFVLSGFLITGILLDNRRAKNYFKVFYIRRVSRIFPLYYFFLLLFIAGRFASLHGDIFRTNPFANPLPMGAYFVYLQNFVMAAKGAFGNEFLAVTWSLAVEEQFYLFLPLFIRRSKRNWLPVSVVVLISVPLLLRAWLGNTGFYGFVLLPWRLDSLFLGALLAIVMRTPNVLAWLKARIRWIRIIFILLAAYFVYSSMTEELGSLDHLFVFALLYTVLIFLTLADGSWGLGAFFRHPALVRLGLISYGVYMFHQLTNGILQDLVFGDVPRFKDGGTIFVSAAAFAASILLASGTYHAFEKRFVAFGHTFKYATREGK